jgi:hypothetical protein
MPAIRDGLVTVYCLFDVADRIRLTTVRDLLGGQAVPARLRPKPAPPASLQLQYLEPPLLVEGGAIEQPGIGGFRVRARIYGYGVVSLALTREFRGDWDAFLDLGQPLVGGEGLAGEAEACVRRLVERLRPALDDPRHAYLAEDYVVFAVTAFETPVTAEAVLEAHGAEIAHLVRGERRGLSRQECDEVLRNRLSYFSNDLVVPTWNAAFVYDTPEAVEAALEIAEFANSQLLEFRYYDALLDSELTRIYADLQRPRWYDLLGRRRIRAAHHLHALFIEVNELTDKLDNALKLVGDVYAARLYALVAARLGLDHWRASVQEKLETLDDIYRFAVEQLQIARGHLLELTIILILLFELALFFMGIMT